MHQFDLLTGLSLDVKPIQRWLSEMGGMYADEDRRAETDDVLVYEFYDMGIPENSGDIAYGTSMVYPGKVGDEYFMTKGHFHTILDTATPHIGSYTQESVDRAVDVAVDILVA